MALEDRIRSTLDPALGELTARVDADVRAIMQQLISAALDERDEAVAAVRRDARDEATALLQREISSAEARGRTAMDEAVQEARTQEREAEMAALGRLLDSVRGLDGASSLSEVLDVLGRSAGREAFTCRRARGQARPTSWAGSSWVSRTTRNPRQLI